MDDNPYLSPQIPASQPPKRNWRRDFLILLLIVVFGAPVLYVLEWIVQAVLTWDGR